MTTPLTLPVDLLRPTPGAPTVAAGASKAAIASTAQSFESVFVSNMLGEMFAGVSTDGPFGGGSGEAAFRSFLMDAIGQQIVKRGGIGVAQAVQREMLKMQGLS
ncbi:MAG TPA: rod-binding protein [Caulobacteraceae bacterium]|nr:rod-binding protein [Caulobacteraceae bacterium]